MIASERKVYIMNRLNKKGIINLKEIAQELEISEITVRRDLEGLERAGKLKRVQGGAARADVLSGAELTMKEKSSQNMREKIRVAEYAARFVKDGDCVFIDGGTSMVPLIDYLGNKQISIMTYNDLLMKKINKPIVAEVFVVGGRYLPYFGMNVGQIAQDVLRQFHFNVAFFGCAGVNLGEGICYGTEMESISMKQIALANSDHSYLLIDSSKMEKRGFLRFADISAFDAVISNRPEGGSAETSEKLILI
ncbi:MAG: DeoR/GlpR family DNA-binding transcription regulator [Christensenella sp.]|nr:DeoR/GlpR family DNA-binding transcription regulator [Christensenella sp.]